MACPENIQIMSDNSDKQSWLLNYLSNPLWLDKANAALRVILPNTSTVSISGTPAVSQSGTWNIATTSTLTSMSQKAGIPLSDTELRWEMMNAWGNCARRTIT